MKYDYIDKLIDELIVLKEKINTDNIDNRIKTIIYDYINDVNINLTRLIGNIDINVESNDLNEYLTEKKKEIDYMTKMLSDLSPIILLYTLFRN